MGLNRRSFLQALGIATGASASRKMSQLVGGNSLYRSKELGVQFRAPRSWYWLTKSQIGNVIDDLRYKPVDDLPERALKEVVGRPVVVVTRHAEPFEGVNPNFQITPGPPLPEFDLVTGHEFGLESFKEIFHNFKVVDPPDLDTLGGVEASRAMVTYTYRSRSEPSVSCRVETWHLDLGHLSLGVSMGDRTHGGWSASVVSGFEYCKRHFRVLDSGSGAA